MTRRTPLVSVAPVALAALAALVARPGAHDPVTTKVTWAREIVPIVAKHCAGCHRMGGPAPMPLGSYADARPWARAMRAEVVSGRMPRWSPVRGFGHFVNDRSLSAFEISLITAWADGGAPEGDGPLPSSGWRPATRFDARIMLSRRANEPAGERRTFDAVTASTRDRWITGWRFFPNDPAIVQAEFSADDGRYIGNWVPPEEVVRLHGDVGFWLPAGAGVRVTVWYRDPRLQQDFPVGLPSLPPVIALITEDGPLRRQRETDVLDCGDNLLDRAGEIMAVRPLSARLGESLAVALMPPDGAPVPVVRIRGFDPSHLETYRLREPIEAPAGSRVLVETGSGHCSVQVEVARAG